MPKISNADWREYDDKLATLKEYLRANLQDLESICPDQMLLMREPACVIYPSPMIDESLFEELNDTIDK